MNPSEKMPSFDEDLKSDLVEAPRKNNGKGREYHLRLDDMTGMRNKELLYLPEGIEYLHKKFGDEMEMTLGDIAGMGVGNEMLRRPDEAVSAARKNVDDCFTLLGIVSGEIFGEDINERPFEIVRVGGDEIIFITKKGDTRLKDFFERFNKEKEKLLVEERIGREAYDAAKLETNVKAQMKLITKDPEYITLTQAGDLKAMKAWIREQMGDAVTSEKRTGDLLKSLAREKLKSIPEDEWLLPLDFYRSRSKEVSLNQGNEQVLQNIMLETAQADADIAWKKGHPGMKIPEDLFRDETEIRATADKYLKQAKGVERTVREMQEKEKALVSAMSRGENLLGEQLKKEIIRLETVDPGTGAIRLDKSASKKLSNLFEMTTNASDIEVVRLDIPYFGVFNNHYDYATADEMMKRLAIAYRRFTHGVIVRDGGNLFALHETDKKERETEGMENTLNAILSEYANSEDKEKMAAMKNEAMIKKAVTRQSDPFGKVKLFQPIRVDISENIKLSEVIRYAL